GGAAGGHEVEAGAEQVGELFLGRGSGGADGGHDAAAGFEDVEVGDAAALLVPLVEAVAGPAGVGVAVGEGGHEDAAGGVDLAGGRPRGGGGPAEGREG